MVVALMEGEGVMLARLGMVAVGPSGRPVVLKVGRAMLVVVLVALGKFRKGVIRMALTTS